MKTPRTTLAALTIGGALAIAACAWFHHEPADAETWKVSLTKDGAGALDGKTYEVTMTEVATSKTEKENVEFHGGRFHSVGCDPYGFTTGAYTTTRSAETTAFTSDTSSVKEGAIHWRGTVRGDSIEGSFTWTKQGEKPREYTFKGTRKT